MQQAQDAAEIEEVDGEQLVWPDFDVFNPTAQLFVPSNLPQVKSCRSRIVRCVQMNQLASAISMIKKLTLSVRADETDVAIAIVQGVKLVNGMIVTGTYQVASNTPRVTFIGTVSNVRQIDNWGRPADRAEATINFETPVSDVAYKGDDRDSLMITLTADFRVEDSMYLDE